MKAWNNPLRVSLFCVVLLVFSAGMLACQKQAAHQESTATSIPQSSEATIAGTAKVTAVQVQQWMDAGESFVVLDSRSGKSWSSSTTKASGAIRVPPDAVARHLAEIPRGKRIVVYCT